eukprot:CAMPEP_0175119870 /NCGR_PEP_ID=MMETSP0087-20121206/309_1 /TAXON_ID=136419 /ORGANISM="Unknown Unknown, Strain D1" /LENGTH=236 /DNA_ID=CAMNT_0016401261 /DNA_START=56 /DNA_END=766 /DNA_ORIENTATION=-
MQVLVDFASNLHCVDVVLSENVRTLKAKLSTDLPFLPENQILSYQGKILQDESTLEECGLDELAIISLSLRLRGGFYYIVPFLMVVGYSYTVGVSFLLGSKVAGSALGRDRFARDDPNSPWGNGFHGKLIGNHVQNKYGRGGYAPGVAASAAIYVLLRKTVLPSFITKSQGRIENFAEFKKIAGPRFAATAAAVVVSCFAGGVVKAATSVNDLPVPVANMDSVAGSQADPVRKNRK